MKTVFIIHFYVFDADNFLWRKILDDFKYKSNFGGVIKANKYLAEIGREERMKIVKDAIIRWNWINDIKSEIINQNYASIYLAFQ